MPSRNAELSSDVEELQRTPSHGRLPETGALGALFTLGLSVRLRGLNTGTGLPAVKGKGLGEKRSKNLQLISSMNLGLRRNDKE